MLRGSIRFAYADIVGWDNTDVVFRRLGRIYVVLIARVDSKKQLPKNKRGDKVRTNWRKLIAATPKTTQPPLPRPLHKKKRRSRMRLAKPLANVRVTRQASGDIAPLRGVTQSATSRQAEVDSDSDS